MNIDNIIIEESAKKLAAAILAMAAVPYGMHKISNTMHDKNIPIEDKIEAIKLVQPEINSMEFDKEANNILNKLESIPLKKKKVTRVNPEPSLREYSEYIIPSEIFVPDLDDPINKKFYKPYKDDKGLWTIGIGHLIGRGSDSDKIKFIRQYGPSITKEQILSIFDSDVKKHLEQAKKKFANEWDKLSPDIKKAIVDVSFRGDLFNPHSNDEFEWVQDIKNGNYEDAARKYIDHKEYKGRVAKRGQNDGVVKRMNRNSSMMAKEKPLPVLISNDE